MKPVRWGVLGTAGIALNRVIPAMRDVAGCVVTGIASRDLVKASEAVKKVGAGRPFASYEALLADPAIEVVYIPLPNHLHVEWCLKALAAGKHVLCEKPIGMTAKEARRLHAARDRSERIVEEAFAIRNHPQWSQMRSVLASGEIGAIRSVQATLAYENRNPHDIRNQLNAGGGALYDIGSYAIAGCRYLFNEEPRRVMCVMERDECFGIDRLTTAMLEFPSGHASFMVTTQGGPDHGGTHQHLGVVGSRGWMRADFPFSHSVPSPCRPLIGDNKSIGSVPARQIAFPIVNQYARQADRFSRLVRGEDAEAFPLEGAIANMSVIDALFRSAASGTWEWV